MIDVYAHIVPPRYLARIERLLQDWQPSERVKLYSSCEFFGADHVLFGTDMPLGGPQIVPDTLADIRALGLDAADEAKILQGNAERLLGIQP